MGFPARPLSNRRAFVALTLDHLDDESEGDSVDFETLFKTENSRNEPGSKLILNIPNGVSAEEQQLYKFSRDQMKKKGFDKIVEKSSNLLKTHPSSVWAHFFYGVACKRIPALSGHFVPALAHAVAINPNFLSGWQALHRHFLSQGGFFNEETHDATVVSVKALLKLEPDHTNWSALVGQIWRYVTSNDFEKNLVLSIMSPYVSSSCPQKRDDAAHFFVNFIRTKKKLLTKDFSSDVLKAFQILLLAEGSENYRLGVFLGAIRYFNRTDDAGRICDLLKFIYSHDLLKWNQMNAREFAYNFIYELFKTLGDDALEAILILKEACRENTVKSSRYYFCDSILKLTFSYSSLIENYTTKKGKCEVFWGRMLYLKVLTHLKLYQEAYEQILVDLSIRVELPVVEKYYMEALIEMLSHAQDPVLQRFVLRLGYKYLKMYGLNVSVLHHLCFANVCLGDRETALTILHTLTTVGAFDDVIYLQALLQEDKQLQLEHLKALDAQPNALLLAATIHKDLGKSKKVVRSMLEASFHFHSGVIPFEWLGIYYYEREMIVKSTRYFLEAFSNYLVSPLSVNYMVSIYSKHGDLSKIRAFFETLNSRKAITVDVACAVNLKAGLNYLTKATEPYDFHRALEKFRKVTDFYFERRTIEMVADSLAYFGMHGTASDFYCMCHAEMGNFHVYPSVFYANETKMVKRQGLKYLNVLRSTAAKAPESSLALYTFACALFDRALASYSVNNYNHCSFLCQQALLVLSRCIALYSKVASFWITLGNILFTVASMHADFSTLFVPAWLWNQGKSETMVGVKKESAFILMLRCYSVALKVNGSPVIQQLVNFYIALAFRYAKVFYKHIGNRMLHWALEYALNSCDIQSWQRHNLCGVILASLGMSTEALDFFKDAMTVGALEDARDAEFNLGIVYLSLGEFTAAHEVFMYRRGRDPMDSLVWRSYMILHHCLGDKDMVLHYLWFLIYSIKHYPSLEQGIEYLDLICNSAAASDLGESDYLKKKCLLYSIFSSRLFMKLAFIGDCEVPHKFNNVSALNYFYHGEYLSKESFKCLVEETYNERKAPRLLAILQFYRGYKEDSDKVLNTEEQAGLRDEDGISAPEGHISAIVRGKLITKSSVASQTAYDPALGTLQDSFRSDHDMRSAVALSSLTFQDQEFTLMQDTLTYGYNDYRDDEPSETLINLMNEIREDINLLKGVERYTVYKPKSVESLLTLPSDKSYLSVESYLYNDEYREGTSEEARKLKAKRKKKQMKKAVMSKKTTSYNVECWDENCGIISSDEEIPMDEFKLAKTIIADLPADEALTYALKYLKDRGDPMAALPDVHKIPKLLAWYNKRLSVNKSPKVKALEKRELLELSRHQWNSPYFKVNCMTVPALPIPRCVSWDWIDRVKNEAGLVRKKHFRHVKQQLVTNARNYFSSMCTEYYDTKLMKDFRKTFFAYLPSKEIDCITYNTGKRDGDEEEMLARCYKGEIPRYQKPSDVSKFSKRAENSRSTDAGDREDKKKSARPGLSFVDFDDKFT